MRYERTLVEVGVGHFVRKFHWEWGLPTNCWCKKIRVPGLTRGVVCVVLSLAV